MSEKYVITSYKRPCQDLDYLFDQAAIYPTNRHKENYVNFDQDYIASSILYVNNKPTAFSLLQQREIFNGMARCLTRLFFPATKTKALVVANFKPSDGMRPEIYQMFDQQIQIAREQGITNLFFSRNDHKPWVMKSIYRGLIKNGYDWNFDSEKRYYVTPNSKQWIIWTGENTLTPEEQ